MRAKSIRNRIISIILCFSMIFSSMPLGVFADVNKVKGNDSQTNSEILSALESALKASGTSEADITNLLTRYNLLDENGNLQISKNLNVGGKSMTLEEVVNMLGDPSLDLTQMVSAEGVSVSLLEFKKMIEIELKIIEIKNKYFSGNEYTTDELAELVKLLTDPNYFNQSLGRPLGAPSNNLLGSPLRGPSQSVYNEPLKLEVTPASSFSYAISGDNFDLEMGQDPINTEVEYNLSLVGDLNTGESAKFQVKLLGDNLISEGVVSMSIVNVPNALMTHTSSNIWEFNIPQADIASFNNSSVKLTITVNTNGVRLAEKLSGISGKLKAFVEISECEKIAFKKSNNDNLSDNLQISLNFNKTEILKGASGTFHTNWNPVATHESEDERGLYKHDLSSPTWFPENYYIGQNTAEDYQTSQPTTQNFGQYITTNIDTALDSVIDFASGLYGDSGEPKYAIEADVRLDDIGKYDSSPVSGTVGKGYMEAILFPSVLVSKEKMSINSYTATYGLKHRAFEQNHIPFYTFVPARYFYNGNAVNFQFGSTDKYFDRPLYDGSNADAGNYGEIKGYMPDSMPTYKDGNADKQAVIPFNNNEYVNIKSVITYTKTMKEGGIAFPKFLYSVGLKDSDKPVYKTDDGNTFNMFPNEGFKSTRNYKISLFDDSLPVVKSLKSLPGDYSSGDLVPIYLEFNKPVKGSTIIININGYDYTGADLKCDVIGKTMALFYKVKESDTTNLVITKVSEFEDIFGVKSSSLSNENSNNNQGWSFDGSNAQLGRVNLKSVLMKKAVSNITLNTTELESTAVSGGVDVKLTLNNTDPFITAYNNYDTASQGARIAPFKLKVVNKSNNVILSDNIDTFLELENGSPVAKAKINGLSPVSSLTEYKVYVIAYQNSTDTVGAACPLESSFKIKPIIFVNGVSVLYPQNDSDELKLTDIYRPKLVAHFTKVSLQDPTFKTGTWSSSDEEIATISNNSSDFGQVTLTNKKLGKVKFTFVADDGGYLGSTNSVSDRTAVSK